MDSKEFNAKKKYSEGSGIASLLDSNIDVILNKHGIYEEIIKNTDQQINPEIKKVLSHLNQEKTIDDISKDLFGGLPGIKHDSRIGYFSDLYIGHVSEGMFRENGSSGGFGTWIALELLHKKLIDGVIHVKPNTRKDPNCLYTYQISRTSEEIIDGAKSKYYPTNLAEVLKVVKEIDGKYLIVGIPGFIKAIRLLAMHDSVIKNRIKYTIGIICGHQKSTKYAEYIGWQLGIEPGNLVDIDFRKKVENTKANAYHAEVTGYIDGELVTKVSSMNDLYGTSWGEGHFKVESSDFSDDVMNETADVTLGDAWLPEYIDDWKGNSIVIVRNSDIAQLFRDAIETNRVCLTVTDSDSIHKSQLSHFRHTRDELAYRLYRKEKRNEWHPKFRVDASKDFPFFRKMIQKIRWNISTNSHYKYEKAIDINDINYYKKHMNRFTNRYLMIYALYSFQKAGFAKTYKRILKRVKK